MPEAISLIFGMWSTEVGGNVHSKICLVSSRQHRATQVRKLRFLSSCQYTHGVARRFLGPHDTLPCVLMTNQLIRVVCKPCLNQFHRVMVFVYSFFSPLLYYGTKHYVPRLHGISTKFPLVKYNYVAAKHVNLNLVLY